MKRRPRKFVISSSLPGWPASRVREALGGLPIAHRYRVVVKPLRYRTRPSLQAQCDFAAREMVIRVPEPFHAFTLPVYHRAKRLPGRKMRFRWYSTPVTFRSRREVIRYLYCHEYFHYYMWEELGRKSAAETACERFALENFRRRVWVTLPSQIPVRSGPRNLRAARSR